MDSHTVRVVLCNLEMQLTLLVPVLIILITMLVIVIPAVSIAVLTNKILQGKTKRGLSCPQRNPVSEESRDTGSLVVVATTKDCYGDCQKISRESSETVQPVEQQSTDVGQLVLSP